jgi:orotate phosphoribosyltransferase
MISAITNHVLLRFEEAVALMLLDVGAIKLSVDSPFRLVSGSYSPIYINCRQVISDPTFMALFVTCTRLICERKQIRMDVVAGGETAGIPFAAYLAQGMSLPMVYVRKAKKNHGIDSLVEGALPDGAKVVLVEDLITDAGSKLHFIEAIQASGGTIEDVIVLFDREQGGREALLSRGVQLHAVTGMATAMRVAEEANILSDTTLRSVREYLASPHEWQAKRGLGLTN